MIDLAIILVVIFILTYLFFYLKNRYLYWENRQVPYIKSSSLIFGNDADVVFGRVSMAESVLKNYNDLAPHRYGGVFSFYNPLLYIRDPELVKNILIKDFNHFCDRSFDFENEKEPLTWHLFNLTGEKWKLLRNKLSPTYTSGKMKLMFEMLKECTENLKIVLDEKISSKEKIDVKDLMARYTIDVISTCAFGLQSNTLKEPDSRFRAMGEAVFGPTLRNQLRNGLFSLFPNLMKGLGVKIIPSDVTTFFTNIVQDAVEYRKENDVQRNDFLNLLISIWEEEKVKKTKNLDFNVGLLTAQCFLFFIAGFETSSNALSFVLFELANHQDIQKKLQDEVDCVLERHNGQITYDALQEMHYMDKVINETTRLYPAVPMLMRVCTQDYPIPNSNHVIKKGEALFIPVYGLHNDPNYFENANSFDPEHFSDDAKSLRPNCCFLPFGEGPRICIGMRFGLMQIKSAVTTIMRNYTVTVNPEMKLPLQFMPQTVLTTSKDDILLNMTKR